MRNAYFWLKDFLPKVVNNRTSRLEIDAKDTFNFHFRHGDYDELSEEDYDKIHDAYEDASSFWQGKEHAYSFYVFMKFFNSLDLTDGEIDTLAHLLGRYAEKTEIDLL